MLGIVLLIMVAGLIGIGMVVDYLAKKRGYQINPEEGAKNASEAERIYVESALHYYKNGNDTNGPF